MSLCPIFVAHPWSQLAICFFTALWPRVASIGSSSPFACSHMSPVLELRHLSGFSSDEYRSVPQVLGYMHNVCKFFVWTQWNDFRLRSIHPSAVGLIASIKVVTFLSPAFRFFPSALSLKGGPLCLLAMGRQWCSRKFP